MEFEREAIEGLKRTHGYDQKEVEAAYHLGRARSLIREMYTDRRWITRDNGEMRELQEDAIFTLVDLMRWEEFAYYR